MPMQKFSILFAAPIALFPIQVAAQEAVEAAGDAISEVVEVVEVIDAMEHAAADVTKSRARLPRNTLPRPSNRRSGWIGQTDYPIAAWKADEEGRVGYELEIDNTGKAIGCSVTKSSDSATLDKATCDLMLERAEFTPALSEDGVAEAGVYNDTYRWRKREPKAPQMSIVFQYLHDENGQTKRCKVIKMEGDVPEDLRRDFEMGKDEGEDCPKGLGSNRGTPYRDENGVPVAKRVTFAIDVVLEDPEVAADTPSQ